MTIPTADVNLPEIVAELASIYPRYERALVENDVETLVDMFWGGEQVMRFGATENLYGPDKLNEFRKARVAINLAREIKRIDIVSFGRDYGSITLEFERDTSAGKVQGRQSQVWVRFPQGWRIVSAHVSILPHG